MENKLLHTYYMSGTDILDGLSQLNLTKIQARFYFYFHCGVKAIFESSI